MTEVVKTTQLETDDVLVPPLKTDRMDENTAFAKYVASVGNTPAVEGGQVPAPQAQAESTGYHNSRTFVRKLIQILYRISILRILFEKLSRCFGERRTIYEVHENEPPKKIIPSQIDTKNVLKFSIFDVRKLNHDI